MQDVKQVCSKSYCRDQSLHDHVLSMCRFYKQDLKEQKRVIHTARLKDIEVLTQYCMTIDCEKLLSIRIQQYLKKQLSTAKSGWTFYLFRRRNSTFSMLIQTSLECYKQRTETSHLSETIAQLRDAQLMMEKKHTEALELMKSSHQQSLHHMQQLVQELIDEVMQLKKMRTHPENDQSVLISDLQQEILNLRAQLEGKGSLRDLGSQRCVSDVQDSLFVQEGTRHQLSPVC